MLSVRISGLYGDEQPMTTSTLNQKMTRAAMTRETSSASFRLSTAADFRVGARQPLPKTLTCAQLVLMLWLSALNWTVCPAFVTA